MLAILHVPTLMKCSSSVSKRALCCALRGRFLILRTPSNGSIERVNATDIKLKFYQPFVTCWNRLKEKYGASFEHINGFHNENLNFSDFIDHFTQEQTVADVSIDANANSSTHDVRTLMADMVKPHTKLLAINKIFYEYTKRYGLAQAEKWLEEEWNGAFYLHDAPSASFLPYCYAYDVEPIVQKGLFFINKFKTMPPKHLTTYGDHVLEFVSWAANRSSGAVGLPSYLVYSYYFWYHDVQNGFYLKDPEYYRRQCFQKFVYDLNQPYLRVTECAFTNITLMDRNYLIELFGGRKFPDGQCVIDHIEGIIQHQKVFMEVVAEIREETMMTFPVLTYSLLYQNEAFVDEEFARWCNRHNMRWYDSNFYVGNDVSTLSNCCRLLSDTSKMSAFINSIGGTSLSVGSVKVNTINLRRIALESGGDEERYMQILQDRVGTCMRVLTTVRGIILRNVEKGLLPNYTQGLMDIDKQYCTIGITAMYETMNDFGYIDTDAFGYKSYSAKAMHFSRRILQAINRQKDAYEADYSFNVECIPAERANVVLCDKDSLLYPDAAVHRIYSNQWIPLVEKCTLQEKIRLGAELDKECGGGSISHINVEGRFANEEQAWTLLNHIAKQGVIYFAYNTKISVCANEHGFFGSQCPRCGEPKADEYSRVVGFLTPTSSYSRPRRHEFTNRKWYRIGADI